MSEKEILDFNGSFCAPPSLKRNEERGKNSPNQKNISRSCNKFLIMLLII